MALKRLITAADFAKLLPHFQGEYKKDAEGDGYTLDLTDYEDASALRRARDHEKTKASDFLKKLEAAESQVLTLTEERDGLLKGAIPKKDVERLEGSYQEKLKKREGELQAQIDGHAKQIQTLLVEDVAVKLANEISTAPAVILPHIRARLRAEKDSNGNFQTKILDTAGQVSASNIADLKKEFVDNKDFASIITGSKGSGGGASGSNGGGGAKPTKLSDFKTATEESLFANAHPQEYALLK